MDAVFANLLHISVGFFVGSRCLCGMELSGAHLVEMSVSDGAAGGARPEHRKKIYFFQFSRIT